MDDVYFTTMAMMVRKQVYIRLAQEQFLKQRARKLGVTEADLIRQGVDLLARKPEGATFDAQAWTQELAFITQRADATPNSRDGWRFRRDEIYQERLDCRRTLKSGQPPTG
jgi:hypothetical protein